MWTNRARDGLPTGGQIVDKTRYRYDGAGRRRAWPPASDGNVRVSAPSPPRIAYGIVSDECAGTYLEFQDTEIEYGRLHRSKYDMKINTIQSE